MFRRQIVLVALLLAGACGSPGPDRSAADRNTVTIVSSLPLTGLESAKAAQIVNAIRMALEDVGSKVGGYTVRYESLDDADPRTDQWEPGREAGNAQRAAADRSVIAYIGPLNSGAAKVSTRFLCEAGIVMVSPSSTYPGLTRQVEANEPGRYYPDCRRNFTRVVATDDIQGSAAAAWANQLGARRFFVVHDIQVYGKGIADVFRTKAQQIGLTEVGYEGADNGDDHRALARRIKDSGADFVFYGGTTLQNGGLLLRDIRAVAGNVAFMGPDGIFDQAFIAQAGAAAEGAYATFGGLPVDRYSGAARAWLDRYTAKFGAAPDAYAIYGYEAARVVLDGIRRSGDRGSDRATVLDRVFGTRDFDGVFGRWSFDDNGDIGLGIISGSKVVAGKWVYQKQIN